MPDIGSSRKHSIEFPVLCEATFDGAPGDAEMIGPILQDHRLSIMGQYYITSRVAELFRPCCPFAIIRAVVSVIVNSLYGMLGRGPSSHVGKKCQIPIGLIPAITHPNPTSAVVFIAMLALIVTSPSHRAPDQKLGTIGVVVGSLSVSRHFTQKASAASGTTACETVGKNGGILSARTIALPIYSRTASHPSGLRNNCGESAEDSTRQVLKTWMLCVYVSFSHSVVLLSRTVLRLEPIGVPIAVSACFTIPDYGGRCNADLA